MATSRDRYLEKDAMYHIGIAREYYRDARSFYNSGTYRTAIERLSDAMFNLGRAEGSVLEIEDFYTRKPHRMAVIRLHQNIKDLFIKTLQYCRPGL